MVVEAARAERAEALEEPTTNVFLFYEPRTLRTSD